MSAATATAPAITYRKTKAGQWVAFGPANLVTAGATVTVTRRDGTTKQELIASVGRPFTAGGQRMVYGYLSEVRPARRTSTARTGGGGICDNCGEPRRNLTECLDSSGIPGRACPTCLSEGQWARSFC